MANGRNPVEEIIKETEDPNWPFVSKSGLTFREDGRYSSADSINDYDLVLEVWPEKIKEEELRDYVPIYRRSIIKIPFLLLCLFACLKVTVALINVSEDLAFYSAFAFLVIAMFILYLIFNHFKSRPK